MKIFLRACMLFWFLAVCAMQENDQEDISLAELVQEIFSDYDKHIKDKESEFRAAVNHLYRNCRKQERVIPSLKRFYDEIANRITDQMVDLSVDISEERQNEIIASVPFYYKKYCTKKTFNKHYERYLLTKKTKSDEYVNLK